MHAVRLALWSTLLAVLPLRAAAQACHAPPLRDMDGRSVRVEARALTARYEGAAYVGTYQGAGLAAQVVHPWFELDAAWTYYRIERNGLTLRGPGDVVLAGRIAALRIEREGRGLSLGPELAAMLPTGDSDAGLGMGHVMAMPGLFARGHVAGLTLLAQLAYGHAFVHGGGGHVHHHGGALVNPMNADEVEHGLHASYAVTSWLSPFARLVGAFPVGDGTARESVSLGVRALLSAFDLGFEQELPLAGDPFRYRSTLSLGGSF